MNIAAHKVRKEQVVQDRLIARLSRATDCPRSLLFAFTRKMMRG